MNLNLIARREKILSLILIVILCIAGYFLYQYLNPAQLVTGESQQQAETPVGILLGATNAHIPMIQDQLDEAAAEIARLKNLPPRYIIQTVPTEVVKTIEVERQKAGADFAIITNPAEPVKVVVLKEVEQLPPLTPVVLNQYNIQAYKKVLSGFNVYPSFTGITPTGIGEITADTSRKITKDGKYVGITGGYDFDDKKAKVGLRVTF